MASSRDRDTTKADVESVLAEFESKKEVFASFCEKTTDLVEELLKDAKIQYQSVQARIKTRDKLRDKYLDSEKNYRQLNDITDQVALRIITYYEDEVDRAAEIIKREFDVDAEKSIDKREMEPDKFGYYALNYICKYSKVRLFHVEYKKFADICCEIQITSILRHAWAEIEHPWYDLKGAFPDDIKRRFARMAALLEIAESEFLSLRKIQSDYQRSVSVQVEANIPDIPVNAVSLRTFIEQEPLVAEIDNLIAINYGMSVSAEVSDSWLEVRAVSVKGVGLTKLQEVRDALKKHKAAIPQFAGQCKKELWRPSTKDSQLSKGVCIFQLGLMLVSLRGLEATVEFLKTSNVIIYWNVARQVTIAKEIVAKYSR